MTKAVLMRMCMTELLVIHMRLKVLITLLIISFPLAWDTQDLKVLLFSVRKEALTLFSAMTIRLEHSYLL